MGSVQASWVRRIGQDYFKSILRTCKIMFWKLQKQMLLKVVEGGSHEPQKGHGHTEDSVERCVVWKNPPPHPHES